MSDSEEVNPVRKTRSGRAVKTPSKPKAAAKPASRRTRKKVVVMEVEVTDEEDNNEQAESSEPVQKKPKLEDDEDKLLEGSDCESVKNEDTLISSSDETEIERKGSPELVMNDIAMLEEIKHTNEKITEQVEENENKNGQIQEETLKEVVEDVIENTVVENTLEKVKEDKQKENGMSEEVVEKKTEKVKAEEKRDNVESVKLVQGKEEVKELKMGEKMDEVTSKDNPIKEQEKKSDKAGQKEIDAKSEEKKVERKPAEKHVEGKSEVEKVGGKPEAEKVENKSEGGKVEAKSEGEKAAGKSEGDKVEGKPEEEKVAGKSEGDKLEGKSEGMKARKSEGDKVEGKSDGEKIEGKPEEVKLDAQTEKVSTAQNGEPEAENISDDELPGVPVAKVPETEEVSDEELPEPKRAELPADTEVVSEDELPTTKKDAEEDETSTPTKKDAGKRKLSDGDYDPTSPTSENEAPPKKAKEDKEEKDKDGESKVTKPKKLPELDKYWKAVNDDPTDFTGWTYLLQYVDQENDMEAAREAYDAFLSHYPYCYGYWRKYADYEKRKGNKKKCEEVFERGLKAIPLSVDLWIHYLTYVKSTRGEDEEFVRSQFERALTACGLEFRSDRLWDSYIKWETEGKRLQRVTAIFDRLLTTPTQGYTAHFDNFQEHVAAHGPSKLLETDEFVALRKEVRTLLKSEEKAAESAELPPGDEDSKFYLTDEETKCIRERIVSIRRKMHKNTVNAVTARWNFEEGIKRPYFHVKPLERCQLKNWQEYLDFEIAQGDRTRIIVLFERCLIACALYEEFWLKFVYYLEGLKDPELQSKIRDVYERACTIHHLKKPNLHLQWAVFEESLNNVARAAEILVNLEKQVPNVLPVAYRRINLERRRSDFEKCSQLFEHYITNSKNKIVSSNIAIKYSRFALKILNDANKAQEILRGAITKDTNNPRLYLQLVDLILQKENVKEEEVLSVMDEFLEKEGADTDQKALFAQRKVEYLEDFGSSIQSVQAAQEQYHKFQKLGKESSKKKETKSETGTSSSSKKDKPTPPTASQSQSYGNYNYGNSSSQPPYNYSGSQQGQYNYAQYGQGGEQYQYQNWQYPQGGAYSGYNQWGGYTGGYGY